MKKNFRIVLVLILFFMNPVFALQKEDSYSHYDPEKMQVPESLLLEGQAQVDEAKYVKLSLNDAITFAILNNLDIKASRLNKDIAINDIKSANQLQNPSLGSFVNLGKSGASEPNGVGLSLPIDIMKRGARKKVAQVSLKITKDDIALEELSLRLLVRKAYVNLAAEKSNLKILEENEQIVKELLSVAEKKYISKKVSEMDLIQAKMILNQLEIEINTQEAKVKIARYNFNKLLNSKNFDTKEDYLPEESDFVALLTPRPTEKIPDVNTLLDVAVKKRLDLKKAEKSVDLAQKNLEVVMRQRIPNFEVNAGYIYHQGYKTDNGNFANGVYLSGGFTNIPLLYQYTPEIKNAKIQLEQKQIAYDSLKNQATINLKSAYDEFTTAQKNLNYYNSDLMIESEKFLETARKNYEQGKSSIVDFIFVQQAYKSILCQYTLALYDYYDSWISVLGEIKGQKISK